MFFSTTALRIRTRNRIRPQPAAGAHFFRFSGLILLACLLLAACSEPLPPERSLTVIATEMRFEPDELRAKAGEQVFLRMDNQGSEAHNLILELPYADRQISANPGTSAVLSFQATEPGEYRFYCSIPGHEDQTGILIVEP